MNETGDRAATPVDQIEVYLDRIEALLSRIRETAQELKDDDDPGKP